MRRTPASEQYLQAQITLLLHIVYASLLCASIKRSLRLQQALQDRCDLGAGGITLWLQFVGGHAADQSFRHGPAHHVRRLPPGLARSSVQVICKLSLLREKTLQNGSHLSSRRSPLRFQGILRNTR